LTSKGGGASLDHLVTENPGTIAGVFCFLRLTTPPDNTPFRAATNQYPTACLFTFFHIYGTEIDLEKVN
jgi:hypothetical protein